MAQRILVADDEIHLVREVCEILQQCGYETLTAYEGDEVIDRALRFHPDLVLLDIQMPASIEMSVLRQLKSNSETAHIPVVVMSGFDSEETRNSVKQAGATDFIPKPYSAKSLLRKVQECLVSKISL